MPTHLVSHDDPGTKTHIMSTRAPQAQTNANPNLGRDAPTWATDGDPMHLKKEAAQKDMNSHDDTRAKVDKKSPEYLLKSLLAGGIAGCAVRTRHILSPLRDMQIETWRKRAHDHC
jgi:solute carrier family 25 protein 16